MGNFSRDVYTLISDESVPLSPYSLTSTGGDILFLGVTAILYTILIFVVEHLKNKKGLNNAFSK